MHLTLNSCVTDLLKMLTYLACMLRFFVGRCLALERDPLFLRWVCDSWSKVPSAAISGYFFFARCASRRPFL
jgi:hypothetical protein